MINAEAEERTLAFRAGAAFERYREGESDAMGELVALLTPILWHTVRAQRLDIASAEDVLQTSWMALVKHANAIADPRSVLQWLIVTSRREAWRVSRGEQRMMPQDLGDEDLGSGGQPALEELVVRDATDEVLWRHVAELPERCRQLLRVIAFADRPDYAELARSLGMPMGSIGPTRGRCLAKLRSALATDSQWEM
ncbi:MAG: putative polymerase subfamily sigma factor [Frankiales bacterium]|nr:putative polymerase subfamily sigma factor [Frankiales bacterium]